MGRNTSQKGKERNRENKYRLKQGNETNQVKPIKAKTKQRVNDETQRQYKNNKDKAKNI